MRAGTGLFGLAQGMVVAMGGFASLLVGCSDPTPPPAKSSVELHIAPNSSCTANVMRAPSGINHPDSGNVVTDGNGGQVSCHVGSGSTHSFSGSITYNDVNGTFSVSLSANIPETAISADTAVDGSISLFENRQLTTYIAPTTGAMPCKFWLGDPVNPTPTGDSSKFVSQHVQDGAIWGQVSCGAMVADGHANDVCELDPSTFMFLDCQ